jgi:L-2,4-diaminobutyrate decarboxylase
MTRYDPSTREAAHHLVDLIFDHVNNIEQRPVVDWHSPEKLQEIVRNAGGDFTELAGLIADHSIQLHHPSYMGHQVCPPLPTAVMADLLISALNQSTAVWEMSPIATVIEREVIAWLSERIGYPQEFVGGTAVSGGSAANLTALLAARARWRFENEGTSLRPVILCSADAHYSISRAATIMGLHKSDVIEVATDDHHRIDLDELAATLEGLEGTDQSVMAIIATAGSTASGAFDRLHELADMRDKHRTWLHVDAAHGASVVLSRELHHLIAGLERADSLSWDPHKMLWMPLSLGVVLVRDAQWLRAAFAVDAPYLFHRESAGLNLGELTIQCSRRADAIKFWMTLKSIGEEAFATMLDRVAAVTRHLHSLVESSADFEAMHHPQFNIFCFRYVGVPEDETDALNATLRQRLIESGEAWITSTVLKGRRVLRVTIINPETTEEHVAAMLEKVRSLAKEGKR